MGTFTRKHNFNMIITLHLLKYPRIRSEELLKKHALFMLQNTVGKEHSVKLPLNVSSDPH